MGWVRLLVVHAVPPPDDLFDRPRWSVEDGSRIFMIPIHGDDVASLEAGASLLDAIDAGALMANLLPFQPSLKFARWPGFMAPLEVFSGTLGGQRLPPEGEAIFDKVMESEESEAAPGDSDPLEPEPQVVKVKLDPDELAFLYRGFRPLALLVHLDPDLQVQFQFKPERDTLSLRVPATTVQALVPHIPVLKRSLWR